MDSAEKQRKKKQQRENEKEEGNDIDDDVEEDSNKEYKDKNNKPEMFTWVAWERKDLKELADAVVEQLETRFSDCYPELNHLLHQRLDFGIIFYSLCGEAETTLPINKVTLAKVGVY